jgi:hypothetical protein
MAKVAKIESERVLAEVKDIQTAKGGEAKQHRWTPEDQKLLLWYLFKTNPMLKPHFAKLTKEDNIKAYQQFCEDWDKGRLAYPSNTARSLADMGLALSTEVAAEFVPGNDLK